MVRLSLFLVLAACAPATTEPSDGDSTTTPVEASVLGRCVYTNPFSQDEECKEYVGSAWTVGEAEVDCAAPVIAGTPGTLELDLACERDPLIGECVVDGDGVLETITVFTGDDPGACGGAELGCGFSSGTFVPGEVCLSGGEGVASENAFVPFVQVCTDPLPGDPPGAGPDGQVCTWEAVSGATEEGRRFVDYASCEPVFSQRPYYAYEAVAQTQPDDARLSDADWQDEFEWVTGQFESTSCSCCHSAAQAPDGPSGWTLDEGLIWLDSVDDDGLAMLAGWVDSTAFGAFDPEDNNGFDRSVTGVPTTDVPRMQAFLEGELERRGFTEADFVSTPPFGGVLYDQLTYEPEPCADGEGVAADGTVTWTGGAARYVYVLEADSDSPGVPPNLDLPQGTLWRLDVAHTAEALPSGIAYGESAPGATVAWPVMGDAPALASGETYYLIALLDVYQPATRCLFVAP